MCEKIKSISQYIEVINTIIKEHKGKIIVFRGEPKDYKNTSCTPNIFRQSNLNNNIYFEKNILDEMTANHIAIGDNYLEKAINAQHGGFPSRFLDVSYNCLVALHFSVTPHYKTKIDKHDSEDGKVFVFYFDDFFCPTGDGIIDNYEAIINNTKGWYNNNFFKQSYKLIDHIKINERVKAQNGAFIMFQGDTRISPTMFTELTIENKSKDSIRKELKQLFGIDNSTMYPEVSNFVEDIVEKSSVANNTNYSVENEFNLAKSIFEINLDDKITKVMLEKDQKNRDLFIREIERYILYNTIQLKKIFEKKDIEDTENKYLKLIKNTYNDLIDEKIKFLSRYKSKNFEFSECVRI